MSEPAAFLTVREGQGGENSPNYYVIVPFTTRPSAERAMYEIGGLFDCHVISAAAVDQNAPILESA